MESLDFEEEEEEDQDCDAAVCIINQSSEEWPMWVGCECGSWIHLFCARLKLDNIENFQCDFCRSY